MTKKIQQVHYRYLSNSGILFISSKCNTSGIHFYTSWFCKITCVSLLPGDLVSTAEFLNPSFLSSSSFKHFSPPHIHHVPPRQKTMPEQGPCPLLQLPGRQETGNPTPCQAPHIGRLQTPAISTTRETQPRTLRVHSICHFSILFCEPDTLPVVKMKESSLTFQHLNLWWHLQNSKSELQ